MHLWIILFTELHHVCHEHHPSRHPKLERDQAQKSLRKFEIDLQAHGPWQARGRSWVPKVSYSLFEHSTAP